VGAPLDRDPVFGALTRPQMFAGVTYSWFVLEAVATVELFLIFHTFWALPAAGALHLAGYLGCLREPRFFDLWIVRASRCPPVRNARFWRCNSYRP
jgi:type IV secretion system protein VirB3